MTLNDLSGKTIGQYQLKRLLGVGGMGAVYEAYQPSLKRVVALKLLSESLSRQTGYLARFTREAETAAGLEHPHIVPIYDYGATDGISYVAMRLLAGGSLEDRLEEQGALPLPTTSRILHELASALDYAHGRGVIHRDIKPSNVMFDDHDHAFLVDFGIAKLLESTQGLTQTGATMGTPIFMSPEQWKAEAVSAASDQYAVGVLTYFLVTGQAPFQATTPFALMHKHINEMPPGVDLITENPLYGPVAAVINRALAKSPFDRYPSVSAFADAFEQATHLDRRASADAPTSIMVGTIARPKHAKPARLPWIIAGVMTLLALGFMTGMIIALAVGDDDENGQRDDATDAARALDIATRLTDQAQTIAALDQAATVMNASINGSNATVVAVQASATQASAGFDATLTAIATLSVGAGDVVPFQGTIAALQDDVDRIATARADDATTANATLDAMATIYVATIVAANDQIGQRDALQVGFAATATAQSATITHLYATGTAQSEAILALQAGPATEATDVGGAEGLPGVVSAPTGVYSTSATTGRIVGIVNAGTSFRVLALSTDGLWYQIRFVNASAETIDGYTEVDNVVLTSGTRGDLPRFDRTGVEPTPTPSPTSQALTGVVSQQTAIYSTPSLSGRALGLLTVGATFDVLGISEDGVWYQIAFENTSGIQTGYIQYTYLVLYGDVDGLPILDN